MIFINKTPIKWYSKLQNTIGSFSYGSELVAARITAETTMGFRHSLRMLGIEVSGLAVMLFDNQSVVANATLPSSCLRKSIIVLHTIESEKLLQQK
jgi:hypothetical protein